MLSLRMPWAQAKRVLPVEYVNGEKLRQIAFSPDHHLNGVSWFFNDMWKLYRQMDRYNAGVPRAQQADIRVSPAFLNKTLPALLLPFRPPVDTEIKGMRLALGLREVDLSWEMHKATGSKHSFKATIGEQAIFWTADGRETNFPSFESFIDLCAKKSCAWPLAIKLCQGVASPSVIPT